jgi:nucleoside-diphosphate-sugar epimerase
LVRHEEPILITGAAGFIGSRVVENLLERGFKNLRCFARGGDLARFEALASRYGARVEVVAGDLLSKDDCARAVKDVSVILHLAAGRGAKSFPDAFLNSVVTTRNLLEAARLQSTLKRFVSVSSFSVYSVGDKPSGAPLDEHCPLENQPHRRGDAYCFAKVKQDQIVADYGKRYKVPYVIVRPGVVYGPGNTAIHGRIGIGTFGIFLHLGGSNRIPLTYVENCAEAIVLAGITHGIEGEVFNVVDDELPSSRRFLGEYKKQVRNFRSIYLPHPISYGLCWLWEKYSEWSQGQLPPAYNRAAWRSFWKPTAYSNAKLKQRTGWTPKINSAEALQRYFESCRKAMKHA